MNDSIAVNFHCHSNLSDGEQTPEVLAANLASAGVRCAALTDHDTIEGLKNFQDVLRKRGVASISGVELTTQFNGREAHLVGYGFDPENPELAATMLSLRQVRRIEVHSIAEALRNSGNIRSNDPGVTAFVSAAPNGLLEIDKAIALIHRAGGCAFWAHPRMFESDPGLLDVLVGDLKLKGLDGLEVVDPSFSDALQNNLRSIADKYNLLKSYGTDFHGGNDQGINSYMVEMPREDWIKFRDAIFSNPKFSAEPFAADKPGTTSLVLPGDQIEKKPHFRRRSYVLRIFLPTIIAIALFLASIWGIILPSIEQTLLDRKREMIQELTNSAWSILSSYEREERNGLITREQAQMLAKTRIEDLRYGAEGKDYFWIQDMEPRMIMHPYRPDLNEQNLQDFKDPRGVPIFIEFAELVKRKGEGYINYVWQWKDDPLRLEPKESYVKGFPPWGWVIGTGIYIDDVKQEISRIEQSLINTSLVISGVVVLLLAFVLQQSLRIEKERQEMVDNLRESTERYHSLIEATTEGTLLILDDRCRYANPTFLSMLGYTARQFEFLELADLLPDLDANKAVWERLKGANSEPIGSGEALEGCLMRSDGSILESIITTNPIKLSGQSGFILLAKDIARHAPVSGDDGLALAAQSVPVGIFRALAARRGVFLEINQTGREILSLLGIVETSQAALSNLFSQSEEYDHLVGKLLRDEAVNNHILVIETKDSSVRYISLSACLVRDEQNHPIFIDGILEDRTTESKQKAGREALIEKLQASLLFLHEPVANLERDVVISPMDTSIEQLSRLMTARKVTAALVASESMAVIGIVTDHDLRARVLAENIKLSSPVHTVMSAPLIKIPDHALIYEALTLMEEKGVRHLAVEDQNGQIVNVVDNKALVQFHRYGPIVLSRQISRANNPGEVSRFCERITPLVKALMDSSARPRHVTNMLASIYDAATERIIHLAINDLGPPPARFAFIAMGSQGRQEPTLLTDQDNGIIFVDDKKQADSEMIADYFLRLGNRVCTDLDHAGYRVCRGQVMANNPLWCRSLTDWLSGFDIWIQKKEPQEIVDLSIFFDFRPVYGDAELAHELRRYIHTSLINEQAFFHLFAQNALVFKPPFRLLGNIYLGGGAIEHAGEINLKDVMMPIVSFGRLYALRHQINATHTLERIDALAEIKVIQSSTRDEISAAYDFLMELRLQNQLEAIQSGQAPQNIIQPGKLGHMQKELLKQAFAQISAVQKKVSYDFLGGV